MYTAWGLHYINNRGMEDNSKCPVAGDATGWMRARPNFDIVGCLLGGLLAAECRFHAAAYYYNHIYIFTRFSYLSKRKKKFVMNTSK